MRATFLFTIILLSITSVYAQRDNVNLLVQSPDGRTVKLVWFFKNWNKDITGFDIKRKDGLQDWVKLNNEPILPEIAAKKKISIVEQDKIEESRVRAKLYKMISANKIKEISTARLLEKLNEDNNLVQQLSDEISKDYDLALMYGFGFVDRTVTKKTNYEYGVFIQGTNILLDSVIWNYGQIPDLNTVVEITSKARQGGGIQLIWHADADKMKRADVAGFNIYRDGIRMNTLPITSIDKDPAVFTFVDKSASIDYPNQYSISAESLFGIEGIIKSYTYLPDDHPREYKKAVVTDIASLGYYFKDGINVKWDFPKDYNRFIRGFVVEKNNIPTGYKTISPVLDTTQTFFVDKTSSPVSSYVSFRVNVLYNDDTDVSGIERIYSYFPIRVPPTPQNFRASVKVEEKLVDIYFFWDPAMMGDSLTDYYRVYVSDSENGNFIPHNLKTHGYTYAVDHGTSAIHKFYVTSVGKNRSESNVSDTLSFLLPSLELPAPVLYNLFLDSQKAVLQWTFPEIKDLKGFRVYQNNALIASENIVTKDKNEFKTPILNPGENYEYTIKAVSDYGVISDFSKPGAISVPER